MKLLIDTNVVFEMLFERTNAQEAKALLVADKGHEFFMSDYSLHTLGIYLFRKKQHDIFGRFLRDQMRVGIHVLSVDQTGLEALIETSKKTGLDFDDGYQYFLAEKYDLVLVSFDKDFDRTERGKKTPSEVLKQS